MKLLGAEFVTSAAGGRPDGIPRDGLPHVALAGRSNVGKSTLINALCRRRVARTSAAPGKTRLANIYRVSVQGGPGGPGRWGLYLVDLPGYGYARGGPGPAAELRAVAEGYFRQAQRNSQVPRALLVVDARHPGLASDTAASRWLASTGVDQHIVATKIDKLSRGERTRNLKALEDTFGTAPLPVSAVSGEGLDALWQMIAAIVRDGDR